MNYAEGDKGHTKTQSKKPKRKGRITTTKHTGDQCEQTEQANDCSKNHVKYVHGKKTS